VVNRRKQRTVAWNEELVLIEYTT